MTWEYKYWLKMSFTGFSVLICRFCRYFSFFTSTNLYMSHVTRTVYKDIKESLPMV